MGGGGDQRWAGRRIGGGRGGEWKTRGVEGVCRTAQTSCAAGGLGAFDERRGRGEEREDKGSSCGGDGKGNRDSASLEEELWTGIITVGAGLLAFAVRRRWRTSMDAGRWGD
jgi:hypothetical protein